LYILGSEVVDGLSEGIDEKTLLQVNGSMVVGTLFILTLSAFILGTEATSRGLIGIITLVIIVPFILSALAILRSKPKKGEKVGNISTWILTIASARRLTLLGFVVFGAYLGLIVAIPNLLSIGNVEQQCAKSPETFNVTAEPWKCSEFSPGSLADQCARDPGSFKLTKPDCADFIPPSS
jgi:hypothetical protein